MTVKFPGDVVPMADFKASPDELVRRVAESGRVTFITSRGREVAVMQSVADFERSREECDFMRAVVAGLNDLEAGREVSLDEARSRLGI